MNDRRASITTDYGDGFRAGFEAAREWMLAAVRHAINEGRPVHRAIQEVEVPAPMREPTGLEVRGG